jgi:hypothetical protein
VAGGAATYRLCAARSLRSLAEPIRAFSVREMTAPWRASCILWLRSSRVVGVAPSDPPLGRCGSGGMYDMPPSSKAPLPGRAAIKMQNWKPATKAEETMALAYRGMDRSKRVQIAVQKVIEDGMSQAEAARMLGVSRPKVNVAVQARRLVLAKAGERIADAAAERASVSYPNMAGRDNTLRPSPIAAGDVSSNVTPEALHCETEASSHAFASSVVTVDERARFPDFETFDRMYFGNLICPDCGVHHDLPGFHREIMELTTGPEKRVLINMPPYHSKSTCITVKGTLYELCKDPNSRNCVISKSERLAKAFLHSISTYLQNPDVYAGAAQNLIDDYGPFYSSTSQWNTSQIYICGRQGAEKDPSVAAYGVGGQIYGTRWDRMVFDDIADLKNQKNPELVIDQLKWCTQEAGNRVGRNGRQIYVGTRISPNDIYATLQGLPGFKVLRYPCILDEEAEHCLWDDHFPYEAATAMRDTMTPESWQLVYQNVDTPGVGASFTQDVMDSVHDANRIIGAVDSKWVLVAGLDPAGSGKQAGYTAMVLLGVDTETGMIFLVDLVNQKAMKAPQMKDQLMQWADDYPALREIRVETNGLQGQLIQDGDLLQHMSNRGVRVVPHVTTMHNKWDANFGVESMAVVYNNGRITIPWNGLATQAKVRQLEAQLGYFPSPGSPSDLVMALWFAWLGARELFKRSTLPMFNNRRRMPRHVLNRRRSIDFATNTQRKPEDVLYSGRPLGHPQQGAEMVKLANTAGHIAIY